MGTYADAYIARMRECARAMSRDLAPIKDRHLEIRLVEHDAELAERGFESGLLAIEHPNRVLSRDQLMDILQGRDWGPFDRSIDVQVSRLRRRLHDDARESALIKTVRGEGYLFTARVSRVKL